MQLKFNHLIKTIRQKWSTIPQKTWRTVLISVAAVLVGTTAITGIAGWIWVRSLDISKLSTPLPAPSYIYDKNGQQIAQLSTPSKIEPVTIDQISSYMKQAIVAVEDRRFYEHKGVDAYSITRALMRDLESGSLAEGGSTITQQLAKNLFLESDKTFTRKIREAGYAIKIDTLYNKDEVLSLYLNQIYFGEGAYGIEAASKKYFGKSASALTIEEAALLAALPKAPSTYSPIKHKTAAMERRNVVLGLMKEQNYITAQEYEVAVRKPITLKKAQGDEQKVKYSAYVDYVKDELLKVHGFTDKQLQAGGFRIYTELDPKVQDAADQVYARKELFPESKPDQLIQSGAVLLDHKTGSIRAIVGSRESGLLMGINYATDLKRQPGSSFKPIAVYGPALEKGYMTDSILFDGPLDIDGYKPKDWDGQYRNQVTMRDAIINSWNIPAVWLLNQLGVGTGVDFAKNLKVPLVEADKGLSLALGGLSEGVSPLDMAQAYAPFANLGVQNPTHAVTRVTTQNGSLLLEVKPDPKLVMKPETAYTMTLLLQEAVKFGTGRNAAMNRPAAGKTGTTQLPDTAEFAKIGSNGTKDAWFVGYTPELTAAIWLGYDKTDKDHYLTVSGGQVPATLFREMMTLLSKDAPVTAFEAPPGYVYPVQHKPEPQKKQEDDLDKLSDWLNQWFSGSEKEPSEKGKGKKKGHDD